MKILHVISSLEIGGAQRLLSDLLPLIKEKMGENISLLVYKNVNSDFERTIRENGINIISLNITNFYSPFIIFRLIKHLKQHDIVHAHLFPTIYWVAIAGRFVRSPLVYTEHSTNNRRRGKAVWRAIEKYIYKSYNKIISINLQTQSNLKSWLCAESDDPRFVIIENGVNIENYKNANKLNMPGIPENCKVVLMISRFNDAKDQETVIRSISFVENKTIHFVFVGDGPNRNKNEKLSISLNIQHRVHFLGNRIDIPQLISSSYLGIQSSHWEGFGLTAVEFMAGGKPIIASNVEGLKQVVEGAGLLFEAGNEKELATLIDQLINNKEIYENISQKCFERSQKYDIKNMANRYVQIYQEN